MPERLECEVLQKARYINTPTFTFTFMPTVPHTGNFLAIILILVATIGYTIIVAPAIAGEVSVFGGACLLLERLRIETVKLSSSSC